ncbi:MAG: acetyl-CoA carboxylase biotin carboxyl carrier protein [Thermomicrobiales bacterium]|nr:acetyl-CoA carboxylase biotin carboxyl carrier protein [Thermomicrobiales bacterium]
MQRDSVTELDLELGPLRLRLRRDAGTPAAAPTPTTAQPEAASNVESGHVVAAPMVGTFYISPTPSSPPFVAVGDHVVAGQTIGIIEAMKIMNEITTDRSGVVQEFLVGNAQPVEYGSPLIRVSDIRG